MESCGPFLRPRQWSITVRLLFWGVPPMRLADRLTLNAPLIILLYYGFHAGLRASHGDILIKDEAEAIVMAQFPLWGYGPQPPLFSWLLWPLTKIFGPGVMAIAVLKHLCLAGTVLSLYWVAKRLTGSLLAAAIAAFGAMLIPQLAWESHRELTHTVLATTLCALSLMQVLRTVDNPRFERFLLLGALSGLALLAKYNTVFFLTGLYGAALLEPTIRARLWRPALALVPLIIVAITLPHAIWMITNPDPLMASMPKLRIDGDRSIFTAMISGVLSFLNAAIQFAGVAILAFGLVFFALDRKAAPAPAGKDAESWAGRFLLHLLIIASAATLIMMFASGSTAVRDRWLQPILFVTPLALTVWLSGRITEQRTHILVGACAVLAVIWTAGIGLNHRWDWLNKPSRYAAPVAEIVFQMKVDEINPGTLIVQGHWIAGNLKQAFPNADVITERFPMLPVSHEDPVILVWDANSYDEPPVDLQLLYRKVTGKSLGLMPLRVYRADWPPGRKQKDIAWAAYGWRENQSPPKRY